MVSSTYGAIARRREEAEMTDTCRIVELVAVGDASPTTGKRPTTERLVYEGPCEFVASNTQVRDLNTGGRIAFEQAAVLKLPVSEPGSAAVHEGHVATITLASHDEAAPVVRARISGNHDQTFAVSRRLPVEVTSSRA